MSIRAKCLLTLTIRYSEQVSKVKTATAKAAVAKQAVQLIDSKRAYNMSILMNGEVTVCRMKKSCPSQSVNLDMKLPVYPPPSLPPCTLCADLIHVLVMTSFFSLSGKIKIPIDQLRDTVIRMDGKQLGNEESVSALLQVRIYVWIYWIYLDLIRSCCLPLYWYASFTGV